MTRRPAAGNPINVRQTCKETLKTSY